MYVYFFVCVAWKWRRCVLLLEPRMPACGTDTCVDFIRYAFMQHLNMFMCSFFDFFVLTPFKMAHITGTLTKFNKRCIIWSSTFSFSTIQFHRLTLFFFQFNLNISLFVILYNICEFDSCVVCGMVMKMVRFGAMLRWYFQWNGNYGNFSLYCLKTTKNEK